MMACEDVWIRAKAQHESEGRLVLTYSAYLGKLTEAVPEGGRAS